jgi:hypothetical protein
MVRYTAWTYVTLRVLGLLDIATQWLDGAGFSIGEFRLSALLIVQAFIIIGALIALARFVTTTTTSRIRANEDISPFHAGADRQGPANRPLWYRVLYRGAGRRD